MREEIARGMTERTPQAIAASLARLVNEGRIPPGERLPTVRELAAELAVSPATVSAAWQALSRAGLIVSRGRAGSFVRETRPEWLTPRIHGMSVQGASPRLDLSIGTPDTALLPSLTDSFVRVAADVAPGRYHDRPVLPALAAHLESTWPVPIEALTVTDGALDAVARTVQEVVRFGDRVAVESPGFPHFFDLLDAHGAQPVPLALDDEGVRPDSLARAVALGVSAVILQPRAQNPTGTSMSEERAHQLADAVRSGRDADRVVVIEDDHSGLISTAPDVTLARWIPRQVVHIRSFSKSHGPDLRIAALAGPARIVDRIVARRILGPGWTSRILQAVLLDLLTAPESIDAVRRARELYRERQASLVAELAARGIRLEQPDGINLWLPVASEAGAIVHLAAAGIGVAPGSSFTIGSAPRGDAVRVTVGLLPVGSAGVAAALADAASPPRPALARR